MDTSGGDALLDFGDASDTMSDVTSDVEPETCRCLSGETCCLEVCLDLSNDPENCGACGQTCGPEESCVDGNCLCEAPAGVQSRSCNLLGGETCCVGTGCVDLSRSPQACGACGLACNPGETCETSLCACGGGVPCTPGTVCCGGSCCGAGDLCCAGACHPATALECQCGTGGPCAPTDLCCDVGTDSTCINPVVDLGHCGACGASCGTNQLCNGGACECAAGYGDCDGSAATGCDTDLQASDDHCGACGNVCAEGTSCVGGRCICPTSGTVCAVGEACCADGCTNLQTDEGHCGACEAACPAPAGGVAAITCILGGCQATCSTGRGDCNNNVADGCETETQSNDLACGGCSPCGPGESCVSGACECTSGSCLCSAAEVYCGGQCVNTNTSGANCGGCGIACSGGKQCSNGSCQCPSGTTDCSGTCQTLTSDAANCGSCGRNCQTDAHVQSATCSGSACTYTCASGWQDCTTASGCETQLGTSSNCGSCGDVCTGGEVCSGGACVCPAGQTDCGGTCVNTSSSDANCGSCGFACPAGKSCSASQCACATGQTDCGGTCVDLQSNNSNCGFCSFPCSNGTTCQSGSCTCSNGQPLNTTANCGTCGNACSPGWTCSGGTCICPSGYVCRGSAGPCDPAEVCDGTPSGCPADSLSLPGTTCRAANGACDVAETCTGSSAACPSDGFASSATQCRAASGACDVAENCTGSSTSCPANGYASSSTTCRSANGTCDVAEKCTGSSSACPSDGYASSSTTCRASAGTCDVAETCTGSSAACPGDGFVGASTVCRAAAAGGCDVAETCTGSSAACPGNSFQPSTYTCRAAQNDGCILAAKCSGGSATCPASSNAAYGTYCKDVEDTSCGCSWCCWWEYQCNGSGLCNVQGMWFSCPILYTWDGQDFAFESDIYTSGTLGLKLGGTYRKPDPHDAYVLRQSLVENNGTLDFRIVEELDEIDFLDEVRLFAVDLPPNHDVVGWANNLPGPAQALENRLVTISTTRQAVVSAVQLDTGADVAPQLAASDLDYLVLSEDENNMDWHTLEVDLGDLSGASVIKLVVDGRSRFPWSQQGLARRSVVDPNNWKTTLEVLDATGAWVQVPRNQVTLVRPKEFPRAMAIDITDIFLTNTYKVRMSWVYKTSLDAIWIDTTPNVALTITEAPLATADLGYHGFSERSGDPMVFNYSGPTTDSGLPPGNYTRFGPVGPLLGAVDDMFAIFGPGDELSLRFLPPAPPGPGLERAWVFQSAGYYKELRLVDDGTVPFTVAPLPFYGMSNFPYDETVESYPDDALHQKYQQVWNTRVGR